MFSSSTLTRLAGSNTVASVFRLARFPLPALCIPAGKSLFFQASNSKTSPNVRYLSSNDNSSGTTSSIMNESTNKEGFRVITPKNAKKLGTPNITVTFKLPSGEKLVGKGREGDSLLDVVTDNALDIDGFGACEGTLACSTCHLIFSKEDYDQLPKRPADEEMDMLDLAYDLCDTSRLGCQVLLTKNMDGLEVTVPASVNDQRLC